MSLPLLLEPATLFPLVGTLAYLLITFSLSPDASRAPRSWPRFRLLGGALLALTAALTAWSADVPLVSLGLRVAWSPACTWLLLIVLLVALPLIHRRSASADHRARYPQIQRSHWRPHDHLSNAATWWVYLLGYEAFFRGFLLLGLAPALGPGPALALTTAFYAAVHLPKGAGETLGSWVMGLLFGVAALESGSFFAPFLAHVILATSNDAFAVSRASEADIVRK